MISIRVANRILFFIYTCTLVKVARNLTNLNKLILSKSKDCINILYGILILIFVNI